SDPAPMSIVDRPEASCFVIQAEDGIRDRNVTGVQTCALPICLGRVGEQLPHSDAGHQVREDRRAAEEQQGLELATHAPSVIATVLPVRAAAYACSTTTATRRMSSR